MKRKKSRMDMLAQQILAMQEELEEVTGKHPASRDMYKNQFEKCRCKFCPSKISTKFTPVRHVADLFG